MYLTNKNKSARIEVKVDFLVYHPELECFATVDKSGVVEIILPGDNPALVVSIYNLSHQPNINSIKQLSFVELISKQQKNIALQGLSFLSQIRNPKKLCRLLKYKSLANQILKTVDIASVYNNLDLVYQVKVMRRFKRLLMSADTCFSREVDLMPIGINYQRTLLKFERLLKPLESIVKYILSIGGVINYGKKDLSAVVPILEDVVTYLQDTDHIFTVTQNRIVVDSYLTIRTEGRAHAYYNKSGLYFTPNWLIKYIQRDHIKENIEYYTTHSLEDCITYYTNSGGDDIDFGEECLADE